MTLALLILAKAAAVAAPPPDFEWSKMQTVMPPPIVSIGANQRPPKEIKPDNVELTGAGEVSVQIPPKVFEDQLTARGRASDMTVLRLWFDPAGKLLSCEAISRWMADEVAPICAAVTNASFAYAPGFAQPLERGYIDLRVTYARRIDPVLPLRFRPKGKGTQVQVMVFDAKSCRVTSGQMSDAVKDQVCKVINYDPRSLKARAASSAFDGGWANVRVWLDMKVLPPDQRIAVTIEPRADRIGENLVYPDRSATEPAMPLSYGTFSLPLTSADFPEAARRWTIYSASTVLVGIGSDGKAVSCRPIASSGAPLLDNRACALAVQRGSFAFTAGVPSAPMRYVTHTVDWRALAPTRP